MNICNYACIFLRNTYILASMKDMEEQRTGNRGAKDRNSGIEPQKRGH
jgi:hypothetical protein